MFFPNQCNPVAANTTQCHGMEWLAADVNTGNATGGCRKREMPVLEEWSLRILDAPTIESVNTLALFPVAPAGRDAFESLVVHQLLSTPWPNARHHMLLTDEQRLFALSCCEHGRQVGEGK